jgi:MoaA/NifB/PqqE/SkfB family radical SAM enzyme
MAMQQRTSAARGRLFRMALASAVKGADLGLRVPLVRDYFLHKLSQRLTASYDDTERDHETLMHLRWLGPHLKPFLHRLLDERPAAARAILRFIHTWICDIYRRTEIQRTGITTPCTVVIEPTDRCNLNCPGCYARSSCDGCDLPFEDILRIVQQVIDMGVTLITISGGEPFLREKADQSLTRLGRLFKNRGFLIYTNGTLIDQETADRMGRAGNLFPAISVEGFQHQTDARRGRGTYEADRCARKFLANAGVMTGFSATVTRKNAEAVASDDFIDQRLEEGDLFGWFFLLQPIGRSPRPDLMVTAEQRAMLREAVYRWRQQNRPIFLGDFWNDGPLSGGCIAGGRYYFHICADGDISPCVFAPVACGNIFDIINGTSEYRSLKEFVQHHPVFVAFRAEQKKIKDRARPCLLIDHPHVFRRICEIEGCRPTRNMTDGYLDGDIARAIDAAAAEWQRLVPNLPPLPAEREAAAASN